MKCCHLKVGKEDGGLPVCKSGTEASITLQSSEWGLCLQAALRGRGGLELHQSLQDQLGGCDQ